MAAAGVGIWAPGENPGTHEEALAAVKLALEVGGGGINDIDKQGETALHGAVYRGGNILVIQLLIDRGARLDVRNKKGWTPLTAADGVEYTPAVLKRYPEAAALLRKAMRERGLPVPEPGQTEVPAATADARSAWEGVFTEAQVTRGQQTYKQACSACHLDDLLGEKDAPALVGEIFTTRWAGATVDDMLQSIRRTMPQEAPDSLGTQGYVDIISYLLKANGGAAGTAELPTDSAKLQQIRVTSRAATR
jgi:mono/diheme cytochrome c family protein